MTLTHELDIHIRELKHFTVFEVQGKIDMESSPILRELLVEHYKKDKSLIIDLSEVNYMDSSGVATLVEGVSWSKKRSKEFVLIGLGLNIYNTLTLAKLNHVFNIKSSFRLPESFLSCMETTYEYYRYLKNRHSYEFGV